MKKWKLKLGMKPPTPLTGRIRGYQSRNQNLRQMGFTNYAEYLRSDLWKTIRARVLLPGTKCFVCDKPATVVHHAAYRIIDLEGGDLRRLYPLCYQCHECIEFRSSDGEKLNITQATAKMRQMRTTRLRYPPKGDGVTDRVTV